MIDLWMKERGDIDGRYILISPLKADISCLKDMSEDLFKGHLYQPWFTADQVPFSLLLIIKI